MKSLPSTYNGVLFRSRLEARWAYFFDLLGVQWVYEPEGFETASGNYLPDFFLPKLNTYVEVKPAKGLADDAAIRYVQEATGAQFLVLDSPCVECRAFPLLTTWGNGSVSWTDTSWCFTAKYLPGGCNEHESRFYVCLGADGDECPNCNGDSIWEMGDKIRMARSLRFNNGVAA